MVPAEAAPVEMLIIHVLVMESLVPADAAPVEMLIIHVYVGKHQSNHGVADMVADMVADEEDEEDEEVDLQKLDRSH